MDVGLAVGRILLVAIFIFSGAVTDTDVSGTAAHIADKGLPMPTVKPVAAGVVELSRGLMVAVGWCTRLAALLLLVFTGAAAVLFHDSGICRQGASRSVRCCTPGRTSR